MLIRGAKAIAIDGEGFALVLRRSATHPYVPLTNDLPGGKVEDGEQMIQGLVRELSEEIGVDVSAAAVTLIDSTKATNYYGKDYELELFEVKFDNRPDITLSFEHDSYRWVKLDELSILGELYEPHQFRIQGRRQR